MKYSDKVNRGWAFIYIFLSDSELNESLLTVLM